MSGVDARQQAPAAARNRAPIRDVLRDILPARGRVLEIASGTGEHAIFLAAAFPDLEWQPTDVGEAELASIAAWREAVRLPNLLAPQRLDVRDTDWQVDAFDAVVCINMIHIAPWASALGLFAGAARNLARGAPLVLYGPFRFSGAFTAPSNAEFDASLRARDPAWGVRDVDDITAAALAAGLSPGRIVPMPANNHVIIFRRS